MAATRCCNGMLQNAGRCVKKRGNSWPKGLTVNIACIILISKKKNLRRKFNVKDTQKIHWLMSQAINTE